MGDAVTSTTISDGTHKAVIQITNLSDGTGEDAVNKVDVSGLAAREDGTACSSVTTIGASSNDSYVIVLELLKNYG